MTTCEGRQLIFSTMSAIMKGRQETNCEVDMHSDSRDGDGNDELLAGRQAWVVLLPLQKRSPATESSNANAAKVR